MSAASRHSSILSAPAARRMRAALLLLCLLALLGCRADHRFVKKAAFGDSHEIVITFAGPVDPAWAADRAHIAVYEAPDPDILADLDAVDLGADGRVLTIRTSAPIARDIPHKVVLKEIRSNGTSQGTARLTVKKLYISHLFTILIGAMVIQNFVFSKYLGLCVFFGTSRKQSTAVGMGVTFTIVIIAASTMSWFLYQFVLKSFRLDYLQIVVFIGLVSLTVQGVDTIALFLMSSVRERLEFADIPASYRGLPIAFIVAGLFALAFMGFSGMSIY